MIWTNSFLLSLAGASHVAAQSFQQTPVMGWNSYNQMSCSPNAQKITTTINALASRGFVAAGYKYFQIDCGWASRDGQRNSTNGALKVDLKAFPNGLQPLADLTRSKGMKWTMYSDAGVRMCDPQSPSPVLGSLGHEAADAAFFKSLGTEYVKYDNCYADGPNASQNAPKNARTDFVTRMGAMWKELQKVGVPGMLICQWGVPYSTSAGLEGPDTWTKGISTSFRLSDDITSGWASMFRIYNQAVHIAKSGNVGPGHIADADLLEVGNSAMSFDEQATHFAAWAMLKSALMISTDVAALSNELVTVLQNKDLIAINQDSAVKPVTLRQRWSGDRDLWAGDLANGDMAVLAVDLSNTGRTLTIQLADLGIASATIKDIWAGTTTTGSSFSKQIKAHGSVPLRLSNIQRSTAAKPQYNYVSVSTGSLSSGANTSPCSGCTSSNKVGNIGGSNGGRVTLSNIRTSKATQTVRFDYINGNVDYMGGTNERVASISVNGGAAKTVSFPLTGYNWSKDVSKDYAVELSGFSTTGPNTITISGAGSSPGPDFDRIGVVA
ncbi:carbohydrate-binding module family 35 protein [Bipolaris victoriae FI3]|uniref:Alpha-galactosidase n=2 Tax=Bipolaris TaxID=33194 RepID=W6YMZ4_COCC2|nr:carbohydrate-binding module family 35 protein [Bipolaris zeicola 26-R-13]XP_014560742.1 carbohydrate-binding module family 35 protein [Bipolaris victoriae FI3]EUC32766.1 carbohydrate-binding module family 35 protein [Bipolaris zeicola 26-R-13]